METKVFTFYEQTIIDNIDFEGYAITNEGYLYDKIKTLYNIFKQEYGFMIDRVGEVNAFKEWLQGLPSVLTVPFMNYEILENAKKAGLLTKDDVEWRMEKQENRFLELYWTKLALAFFELKNNL